MQYNDTLIIVGNGLDLSLNLPTSYDDFIKQYKDKKGMIASGLLVHLLEQLELYNWVDIEMELSRYCLNLYENDNSWSNGGIYKQLRKEYEDLHNKLKKYLDGVMNRKLSVNKNAYALELIKDLCNSQESPLEVISFNYTDTLERLADKFNLKIKVHHVHGSLGTDIVFGVEDSADLRPSEVYLYKSYSIYKELRPFNLLLPEFRRIVFYGYSLGDTDKQYFRNYFEELSRNNHSTKHIAIYHYGKEAFDMVKWQLQSFTGHNLAGLEMNQVIQYINSQLPYEAPKFIK